MRAIVRLFMLVAFLIGQARGNTLNHINKAARFSALVSASYARCPKTMDTRLYHLFAEQKYPQWEHRSKATEQFAEHEFDCKAQVLCSREATTISSVQKMTHEADMECYNSNAASEVVPDTTTDYDIDSDSSSSLSTGGVLRGETVLFAVTKGNICFMILGLLSGCSISFFYFRPTFNGTANSKLVRRPEL